MDEDDVEVVGGRFDEEDSGWDLVEALVVVLLLRSFGLVDGFLFFFLVFAFAFFFDDWFSEILDFDYAGLVWVFSVSVCDSYLFFELRNQVILSINFFIRDLGIRESFFIFLFDLFADLNRLLALFFHNSRLFGQRHSFLGSPSGYPDQSLIKHLNQLLRNLQIFINLKEKFQPIIVDVPRRETMVEQIFFVHLCGELAFFLPFDLSKFRDVDVEAASVAVIDDQTVQELDNGVFSKFEI